MVAFFDGISFFPVGFRFYMYTSEQMQVLDVRPGVTSLASIRYRNENELLEKVEDSDQYYINVVMQDKLAIDLEYIRNVSFGYDIRLVFQTFWEIIRR